MFNLFLQILAFLLVLALILRFSVRPAIVWLIAGVLVALGLTYVVLTYNHPLFAFDYRRIFWPVGRDVWAGINPYGTDRFPDHPFLNPPTALPVFAAFAILPQDISAAIWTIGNAIGMCILPFAAHRVLLAQESVSATHTPEAIPWRLPLFVIAGLTGVVAVSTAWLSDIATGQLSLLVTLVLLAALHAQSRGQPLGAGLWLALASIKITTLLPFLLLFTRWADRRTWLSFAAGVIALTFVATPPTELPKRVRELFHNIQELQESGQVNDYSFAGTQHMTILGLEHWLYRLGLRDRTWIQAGQYILLFGMAIGVASQVIPQGKMPRAAACSLVAALSAIFLYHRVYDAVILVVPLVYCTGWARAAHGAARWVFAGCALAILPVFYLPKDLLIYLTDVSLHTGHFGRLIQAVVLPYATWCVLAVMVGVVVGARLIRSNQVAKQTIGTQK